MFSNPHSTHRQGGAGGRLNLAAKIKNFGKIMVRVFTNDLRIESPSAGEFILLAMKARKK